MRAMRCTAAKMNCLACFRWAEGWPGRWSRWRDWLCGVLVACGLHTSENGLHGEQTVTQPFCGVTLIERTELTPRPLSMHLALIDLSTAGLRLKLTPPA